MGGVCHSQKHHSHANRTHGAEHTQVGASTLPLTFAIGFANFPGGEVSEWPKVPDSKSGVAQATAGSNPALSASEVLRFPGSEPVAPDWKARGSRLFPRLFPRSARG